MQTRCDTSPAVDEIPDELKAFQQWVTWRPEPRPDGKIDKIPVDPHTGKNASVSESKTWGTFHDVARHERRGFVFTQDDPFVGIDLDGCRNPKTGEIAPWALDIIDRFPGWYWESSPSGTGLHSIGKGTLPSGSHKQGKIEVYDSGRFFTMTGDYVAGTTRELENHMLELAVWHAEVFGQKAAPRKKPHA